MASKKSVLELAKLPVRVSPTSPALMYPSDQFYKAHTSSDHLSISETLSLYASQIRASSRLETTSCCASYGSITRHFSLRPLILAVLPAMSRHGASDFRERKLMSSTFPTVGSTPVDSGIRLARTKLMVSTYQTSCYASSRSLQISMEHQSFQTRLSTCCTRESLRPDSHPSLAFNTSTRSRSLVRGSANFSSR